MSIVRTDPNDSFLKFFDWFNSMRRKTMARGAVGLSNPPTVVYCADVSTVQEIQEALPKLSRQEIEAIRDWIDQYLEDQLELTEEVKAKLDQSRREIEGGQYSTRRPD
jgi:hypothetical protein